MALELLQLFWTFKNSTKCSKISFDLASFSQQLNGLLSSLIREAVLAESRFATRNAQVCFGTKKFSIA